MKLSITSVTATFLLSIFLASTAAANGVAESKRESNDWIGQKSAEVLQKYHSNKSAKRSEHRNLSEADFNWDSKRYKYPELTAHQYKRKFIGN